MGYPVSTVLRICRIPRSTYYYRLKHPKRRTSSNGGRPIPGHSYDKNGQKVSDARIKGYLRRLLNGPHAASGYRKLAKLLRRTYQLDRFIRFYNHERLHGGLYDLPPKEYAVLTPAGQIPSRKIAL